MKLKKIEVQSFRSIYKSELNFNHSCIGLVGINEAGKTNVLDLIKSLDPKFEVRKNDVSKDSDENLQIKYFFEAEIKEIDRINELFVKFIQERTKDVEFDSFQNFEIVLEINFDYETNEETRTYSIKGMDFQEETVFLKEDYKAKGYKLFINNEFISLSRLWATSPYILEKESVNLIRNKAKRKVKLEIEELIFQKEQISEIDEIDSLVINNEIRSLEEKIEKIDSEITFDIFEYKKEKKEELDKLQIELKKLEDKLSKRTFEKNNLEALATKSSAQLNTITELEKLIIESSDRIEKINLEIKDIKAEIEEIDEPISRNYSDDIRILERDFGRFSRDFLDEILPEIIFWESKPEYILPSEILFEEILDDDSTLPRPLMNIFRIGLNIQGQKDAKKTIEELSKNGSKRSSANSKINSKVNEFIKSVWEDYDQELKITIEKDLIRFEVYDPQSGFDAKYYELLERSQGCKTFLSFILTIGAESKTEILKNKILLLDEPETHLHPSGQRFLLKELLKISKNNLVIYATHSNHMIIRENYDQHLIVSKEKEKTKIDISQKDRIGYFMQEEVLYNALGVNLSSDLSTIEDYNFVFEGLGDAVIFKHFYENIATEQERPFKSKKIKFYQGGKCSDIKQSFTTRPIQLGTKWVFILDADKPADGLKKFIEGRYRDYRDKDIFVYQYPSEDEEIELEDLMEEDMILEVYKESLSKLESDINIEEIRTIIARERSYGKYSKEILSKLSAEQKKVFIPNFKHEFNKCLFNNCSELKEKEKFKEKFIKYSSFAEFVLSDLKEKLAKIKKS